MSRYNSNNFDYLKQDNPLQFQHITNETHETVVEHIIRRTGPAFLGEAAI